jgi:hypothetical protein
MVKQKWYNTSQYKQAGWKYPLNKKAYEAGRKAIKPPTSKQLVKGLKAAAKKGNIAKGTYIPMAKAGAGLLTKATFAGGAAYGAYQIYKNAPKIYHETKALVKERRELKQSRENLKKLQKK